jgi:hypothetical protein
LKRSESRQSGYANLGGSGWRLSELFCDVAVSRVRRVFHLDDRMNYPALGASVNLAARLEGLNKEYGTTVLVSEAVEARVADEFLFRSIDCISPKGFAAKKIGNLPRQPESLLASPARSSLCGVADRPGRASSTAATGAFAQPWPIWIVLADPTAVITSRAQLHQVLGLTQAPKKRCQARRCRPLPYLSSSRRSMNFGVAAAS